MLQAGGGSGGGVSPAGGGGGGDVARSLAGQVKALRSRVEELLERARDAEVGAFAPVVFRASMLWARGGVWGGSWSKTTRKHSKYPKSCFLL